MASVDRIDSIYNIPALTEEQKKAEKLVQDTIDKIKEARKQSIDLNVNTKSFADYEKKLKELEKTMVGMTKASNEAIKTSTLLAKQKEAEAKATLAQTKATAAATKEQEKATKATQAALGPYKQLELAFRLQAQRAKDLGAQYGVMDKRAQAAAKQANALHDRLKALDATVGVHNRNVGNYSSALGGVQNKLAGLTTGFLSLIGVIGVGSIFKDSINEFLEMDKNIRVLQNTLRNQDIEGAFDRISKRADALAKEFTFLDNDDIIKTFNQLIVYGKLTEDQINELIPVIINFATATGQDLAGATSTIIKALEGNGKALKEYGINIKDAKNTTEAFNVIMTQLAPKVEGVGKAFGESAAGGLASASQEFKNLKEELGQGLLPVLNTIIRTTLDAIQNIRSFGNAIAAEFRGNSGFIQIALDEIANNPVLAQAVEDQTDEIIKSVTDAQKQIQDQLGRELDLKTKEDAKLLKDNQNLRIKGIETALRSDETRLAQLIKSGNRDDQLEARSLKISVLARTNAIRELTKTIDDQIKTVTDPNKNFGNAPAKKAAKDLKDFQAQIRQENIALDKEFDLKRLEDEKLSYAERLLALHTYGEDSERLILEQTEAELSRADITADERLAIENKKNNDLIRLSQELADKLAKIVSPNLGVDTSKVADSIKGPLKQIQNLLDNAKKETAKYAEDFKTKQEALREQIKQTITQLATELQGLFFDLFTNELERQKNAVQDQIDLLEAQKQKDIEVVQQTITNRQEQADAIAIIEARAAAKRQQLELRQRQIDQQKAKFEKARAVTDIIQGTAIAVIGALGAKPWTPANIALAALVGALGAVQISRVLAQPIPRYKEGTDYHKGGLAVVGDGGKSEGIQLPDGTIYKTPAKDTLVDLPRGSKVFPDYSDMKTVNVTTAFDTRLELKEGFGMVVKAIRNIPQPIIQAERAWTRAHRTGSNFRNYLNQSL